MYKNQCNVYVNKKNIHSCAKEIELTLPKPILMPKKLISSKRLHSTNNEGKCASTGKIDNKNKNSTVKPKKIAKSDINFIENTPKNNSKDLFKKFGDTEEFKKGNNMSQRETLSMQEQENIHQYYKNEHFHTMTSANSINEGKNISKKSPSLETITELQESHTESLNQESDYIKIIYDVSDSNYNHLDNDKLIKDLKEFRQKHYFECHSATSRLRSQPNDNEHKCSYRFYLNERLFPVPIQTDYTNTTRCNECCLPLNFNIADEMHKANTFLNGTIQAKVILNAETKDVTLLLPVKEPLIIKEKRRENRPKSDKEIYYYGIIKLNRYGNSIFKSTTPSDSLALRYQKGYKEFTTSNDLCRYTKLDDNDVIYV